ncbi:hypothetical protein YB2330_005470 [Saitoella coloradoensis]
MSSNDQITFYELVGKDQKLYWSPNTWKTHMALHFKGLNFKIEPLTYVQIRETLGKLSEPFGSTPTTEYTCPAITHNGQTLIDGWRIANYLDEQFPDTPKLFPEGTLPLQQFYQTYINTYVIKHFLFLLIDKVPNVILDEPSAHYFRDTRESMFGKKLEEISKNKEEHIKNIREGLQPVYAVLKEQGTLTGDGNVSYADFITVGLLAWTKQADADAFKEIMGMYGDDTLEKLYKKCEPYMAKDTCWLN